MVRPMLHLHPSWISTSDPFTESQQKREEGLPRQMVGKHRSLHSFGRLILFFILAGTFSLTESLPAADLPQTTSTQPQEDQQALQNIQTILVTGTIATWLDVPAPPYNVGVTLKLKLEDAGFHVVFDPEQPHDAKLLIQYQEIPSGQFQILEQATAVRYHMQLVHDRLGEIFSRRFEARPNEIPIGSLYWDTISNLEEDPYYCFVGDLIHGQLHGGRNPQDMLMEILVRPFTDHDAVNPAGSRSSAQAIVQQRARLNIIQALGQKPFDTPEARETLWRVAKQARPDERGAAFTQLGKIGDSSFLSPLSRLLEQEDNPEVRSAAEHAIHLLEAR